MGHTVKAVAELAGVSIRTLHHYDEIGLLRPAAVSPAGYRLYSEADLERLQQVLFFRELDFSLQEIRAMLDSPSFDRREALAAHRQSLVEKQRRLERLIQSVDRTLDAMERGTSVNEKEMFDGFDEAKIQELREEASARWGKDVVDESYRRVAHYTKEDWAKIRAAGKLWLESFSLLMDRNPADAEVQRRIGEHYQAIHDNFYTPTPEVYRGLGDLYVSDPRFTVNYDTVRPGLAAFMRAAMHVYADGMEAAAARS